jgi:hypothetical protein
MDAAVFCGFCTDYRDMQIAGICCVTQNGLP